MADDYRFDIETTSFKQKMESLQSKFPNFIKTIIQRLGMRLLAKVRILTPVDTGLLRRSWFLEEPTATSNDIKIEIKNNVKYGLAVETGHKQTLGGGGRQGPQRFIAGKWMLKRGINEIESNAPQILEKEIEKFANENMR